MCDTMTDAYSQTNKYIKTLPLLHDDSFLAKQKRQPEPAQEARMVRNLSKSVGDLSLDFSLEESKTQKAASRREGSKNGRRSKKEQGQVSLYYDNLGNLQVKTAH